MILGARLISSAWFIKSIVLDITQYADCLLTGSFLDIAYSSLHIFNGSLLHSDKLLIMCSIKHTPDPKYSLFLPR